MRTVPVHFAALIGMVWTKIPDSRKAIRPLVSGNTFSEQTVQEESEPPFFSERVGKPQELQVARCKASLALHKASQACRDTTADSHQRKLEHQTKLNANQVSER